MPPFSYSFEAIGTHWQIDILDPSFTGDRVLLREHIDTRIAIFDQAYSRFRPDSLVMQMAAKPGTHTLPNDAMPLMNLYHRLYTLTKGAFTPLIGQALVDAGYDAAYSLQQMRPLQPLPTWDQALAYHHPTLVTKEPVILDFGAAGKGYLIDLVAEVLEAAGITAYCVDAGGDIVYRPLSASSTHPAGEPLRVGLEHPEHLDEVIGIVHLTGGSICGSAGNRRTWGTWHHIIDPRTLTSPRTILATWVVAKTTILADALATCLFLVPAHDLAGFDFEYLTMFADHTIELSAHFPAEIFTA